MLSNKIQAWLTLKNWTQSDLARKMKVNRSVINRIVKGHNITGAQMKKVADALRCNVWEVFCDEEKN